MNKTLYLHIGAFKTGTTSLQHFLHKHRNWLREQGCLVPGQHPRDHHMLAKSVVNTLSTVPAPDASFEDPTCEVVWGKFIEEVQQSDCPVILVSSESFCGLANRRQDIETMMRWMVQQLEELDVRIVCYLRPLGDYVKSFYKTGVKSGGVKQTLAQRLDQQIARRSVHVSPTSYLDIYAKHFGKNNLVLRKYEKEELINGNTIDDFLQLIELPPQGITLDGGDRNPSLPDEFVDAKLIFNQLARSSREKSNLVGRVMAQNSTSSALEQPFDAGEAMYNFLQTEHQKLVDQYGMDLGNVKNPFFTTEMETLEHRAVLIFNCMLWKEVQDLRSEIEETPVSRLNKKERLCRLASCSNVKKLLNKK